MSDILDLREKLHDTHAAMAQIKRAIADDPADEALPLVAESLQQRQQKLERAFRDAANQEHTDICSYRLLRESEKR